MVLDRQCVLSQIIDQCLVLHVIVTLTHLEDHVLFVRLLPVLNCVARLTDHFGLAVLDFFLWVVGRLVTVLQPEMKIIAKLLENVHVRACRLLGLWLPVGPHLGGPLNCLQISLRLTILL